MHALVLAVVIAAGSVPPFVAPAWLEERLGSADLVVLDARPTKDFLEAHVPGAQSLLADNLRSSSRGVPGEVFPPEALSVVFGRLSIGPDSTVVVYGNRAEPEPAYVATVLRMSGFARTAVLDGGFSRWVEEKRATSAERRRVSGTTPTVKLDPSMLATFEEVRLASAGGSAVLLDVRPKEAFAKGHIPGAISRPFTADFVPDGRPGAGSLRAVSELADEYRRLGIDGKKPTIVYCNSGNMAASSFYVLRHLLGVPNVRLYDGSWLEWVAQPGAPVATAADARLDRARRAADALSGDLLGRLMAELRNGGPVRAATVCSEVAPEIARRHSVDGLTVRRVSLRTRNPANEPDAWERDRLAELAGSWKPGGAIEETVATVAGKLRLLRPIRVGGTCLACHGDPAAIAPEVRDLLAQRYPEDRATGYREGDLRGAISVIVDAP